MKAVSHAYGHARTQHFHACVQFLKFFFQANLCEYSILMLLGHCFRNANLSNVLNVFTRVCNFFFFPIMYDFCAVSFEDNVLILPGAVSTPVDYGPYFFNVGSWLVNLCTMVSLSDWRESFHFISFVPVACFTFSVKAFKHILVQ